MQIQANEDLIGLTTEEINIGASLCLLNARQFGAQLLFLGVVREENEGRQVQSVFYEAHLPLAQQVFQELAQEARVEAGTELRVVLVHRLGLLQVGEVSTVIGVSAKHRAPCYLASRYLIEQLKFRAPVWKREEYQNGETAWLKGVELSPVSKNCNTYTANVCS